MRPKQNLVNSILIRLIRYLSFPMSLMNGISWIPTFAIPLLKFIRPVQRKTFNINYSVGAKLLTRSRLVFSHLCEHRFRHGFRDILNPLCPCCIKAETTTHYILPCHFYNTNRSALMNELNEIKSSSARLGSRQMPRQLNS